MATHIALRQKLLLLLLRVITITWYYTCRVANTLRTISSAAEERDSQSDSDRCILVYGARHNGLPYRRESSFLVSTYTLYVPYGGTTAWGSWRPNNITVKLVARCGTYRVRTAAYGKQYFACNVSLVYQAETICFFFSLFPRTTLRHCSFAWNRRCDGNGTTEMEWDEIGTRLLQDDPHRNLFRRWFFFASLLPIESARRMGQSAYGHQPTKKPNNSHQFDSVSSHFTYRRQSSKQTRETKKKTATRSIEVGNEMGQSIMASFVSSSFHGTLWSAIANAWRKPYCMQCCLFVQFWYLHIWHSCVWQRPVTFPWLSTHLHNVYRYTKSNLTVYYNVFWLGIELYWRSYTHTAASRYCFLTYSCMFPSWLAFTLSH